MQNFRNVYAIIKKLTNSEYGPLNALIQDFILKLRTTNYGVHVIHVSRFVILIQNPECLDLDFVLQ